MEGEPRTPKPFLEPGPRNPGKQEERRGLGQYIRVPFLCYVSQLALDVYIYRYPKACREPLGGSVMQFSRLQRAFGD